MRPRREIRIALAAVLALTAMVWAAARLSTLPARFLATADWSADVALVLGGDARNMRTLRAVELLKAGRARRLLFTGSGHGGDSAEYLAKVALERGANQEDLAIEPRATTTWENMQYSLPLLEEAGAKRVLIVTNRSHARRAALSAAAVFRGIEVKVEPVEDREAEVVARGRELLKVLRYAALGRIPWSEALSFE